MPGKRSLTELHRIVEQALSRVGVARGQGLWLAIQRVTVAGHPIHTVRVAAILHFLPAGSPYCCTEPACHLGLSEDRLQGLGDEIRRALGLRQTVTFAFEPEISVQCHAGIELRPAAYRERRDQPSPDDEG